MSQGATECKRCGSRKLDGKQECQDCGFENRGLDDPRQATKHADWYAAGDQAAKDDANASVKKTVTAQGTQHREWYTMDGQDPDAKPKEKVRDDSAMNGVVKAGVAVAILVLLAVVGVIVFKMTQPVDTTFHGNTKKH